MIARPAPKAALAGFTASIGVRRAGAVGCLLAIGSLGAWRAWSAAIEIGLVAVEELVGAGLRAAAFDAARANANSLVTNKARLAANARAALQNTGAFLADRIAATGSACAIDRITLASGASLAFGTGLSDAARVRTDAAKTKLAFTAEARRAIDWKASALEAALIGATWLCRAARVDAKAAFAGQSRRAVSARLTRPDWRLGAAGKSRYEDKGKTEGSHGGNHSSLRSSTRSS